jgi:hypothetical protein
MTIETFNTILYCRRCGPTVKTETDGLNARWRNKIAHR